MLENNKSYNEFPNLTGFSSRNLKYMRNFAETYRDFLFVQQVVAQIPSYMILGEIAQNAGFPIEDIDGFIDKYMDAYREHSIALQ